MALLIDTQALVWAILDDPKLSVAARAALSGEEQEICVSSVTAFEFVDLNRRGRFGVDLPFRDVLERLEATVLDFPAAAWMLLEALPALHSDPVDRMLVAHAIHADLVLVSADRVMCRYPVRSLW